MNDISITMRRYAGLALMWLANVLLRVAHALRNLAETMFRRGVEMSGEGEDA
jgi:hypothetical protein